MKNLTKKLFIGGTIFLSMLFGLKDHSAFPEYNAIKVVLELEQYIKFLKKWWKRNSINLQNLLI